MKRYVVLPKEMPIDTVYEDLDAAIKSAKEWSTDYADPYYVFELVGAVHPGKPRWRPTERKERAEKPKDHSPVFSDDEPLDYKIRVTSWGYNQKISVIKAIRQITGLGLKESKEISEGIGHFDLVGLPKKEFNDAKKFLEAAGATIEYEIS